VVEIADSLASLLALDPGARATLRRAALLHDIGKLGVSNQILDKADPLTEPEWAVMRSHPRWSLEILTRVPAFHDLARIAAAHHERLDGSGYFAGLTGRELDPASRILAVADVADALSSDRPYRRGLDADEVLSIMSRDAGRTLDPEAYAALRQVLPTPSAPSRWRPEPRDSLDQPVAGRRESPADHKFGGNLWTATTTSSSVPARPVACLQIG
jgi:putative nucleotidyltransferase with HDIG domain